MHRFVESRSASVLSLRVDFSFVSIGNKDASDVIRVKNVPKEIHMEHTLRNF